jgi:hypothetical protein
MYRQLPTPRLENVLRGHRDRHGQRSPRCSATTVLYDPANPGSCRRRSHLDLGAQSEAVMVPPVDCRTRHRADNGNATTVCLDAGRRRCNFEIGSSQKGPSSRVKLAKHPRPAFRKDR